MGGRAAKVSTSVLCNFVLRCVSSHCLRKSKFKQVNAISTYYYCYPYSIEPHLFTTSATDPSQPSTLSGHETGKTWVDLSHVNCKDIVQSVMIKCSYLFDENKGKGKNFGNDVSMKDFIFEIADVIPDVARRYMRAVGLKPEVMLEILLGFQFECERVAIKSSKVDTLWEFFQWASDQNKGFRHLPKSYEVMASLLTRFGMFRKVQMLILTMERQGVSLDGSEIFESLIEGYAGANDLERAVLVYDRMSGQGMVPSRLCYNMLVDLLVRMRRPQLAFRVFWDMLGKGLDLSDGDTDRFENVVTLLCRFGMIREARNITKKVKALGFKPSIRVLNEIACVYCEKKDFEDVLSFFVKTKCPPSILAGNKLIRSLCSDFGVETANLFRLQLEHLGFMPDEITFGILISYCCSERDLRKAFIYLSEMTSRGLRPDIWSYNALLSAVFEEGLWEYAQVILDEMVEKGATPQLSTYKVLLAGYCKVRRFDEAKVVVQEMVTRGLFGSSAHEDLLSKAFMVLGLNPISVRLKRDNDVRFSRTEFYDSIGNGLYLETNLEEYDKKMTRIIKNSQVPDFNLLIEEECDDGNLQAAFLMTNEMSRWGQDLSLSAFSALVKGLKFRFHIKALGNLMEKMPKFVDHLDQEVLNLLVQAYCKDGSAFKAWIIFNQMLQRDLLIHYETYVALIRRLSKKVDLPVLHNFWDIARTGKWLPALEDCKTVVECLCRRGMLKEALELLESMLVSFPNSRFEIFKVFLEKLSLSGFAFIAHMLVEELLDKGFVLDDISYSNIIMAFCKERKHKVAFTMLNTVLSIGSVPSVDVSLILISELCKAGRHEKALALREAISKNQPTFSFSVDTALLEGFCMTGKLVEASNLLQDMFSRGLQPDAEIYNMLFQGYCQSNDLMKARELLGMLIKRHLKLSLPSFRNWVRVMSLKDRVVYALNLKKVLLGETESDSLATYNVLIFYLFSARNSMIVNKVLSELQEKGLTPNEVTYNFLICGFANCKDVSGCLLNLATMISQGLKPSNRSLTSVITCLCDDRQLAKALELSQEMEFRGRVHGSIVQNVIVEGLLSNDKIQEAEKFLDRMVDKDLIPDTICYDNLIKRFSGIGRVSKAVDILNIMLKKGNIPNSTSYDSVIQGYCTQNQLDQAINFHNEMLARDLNPSMNTWNLLVHKLCQHGHTAEAEDVVTSMVHLGETPTRDMYRSVIDRHRLENNPRKASQVMQMMQQSGFEPDFDTQWSLISNLSSPIHRDNSNSSQGFLSRLLSGNAFSESNPKRGNR